jgi:hypothetical protein
VKAASKREPLFSWPKPTLFVTLGRMTGIQTAQLQRAIDSGITAD